MKHIILLLAILTAFQSSAFSQEEEPETLESIPSKDGTPIEIEQSADSMKLDEIENMMEKKDRADRSAPPPSSATTQSTQRKYKSYWSEIISDLENKEGLPPEEKGLRPDEEILRSMEKSRDAISEDISDLATRIDSFFINEPVIYGRNTTNIRLLNTLSVRDEEGVGGDVAVKARLKLPRLKERMQFEVDRQVDEYQVGASTNQAAFRGSGLSQNTRAGLSFFKEIFKFQFKLTGGAEWNHGLVPYINLRISSDAKVSQSQKFTFIQNLFTDTKNKSGESTIVYYDLTLTQNLLFRVLNEGTYRDLRHTFQTTHGMILFHEINSKNSMYYSLINHALNPHDRQSFYSFDYIAGVTYRHRLYKNFLFGEITPAMVWAKDKQWEGRPEISFRLEVIFGKI